MKWHRDGAGGDDGTRTEMKVERPSEPRHREVEIGIQCWTNLPRVALAVVPHVVTVSKPERPTNAWIDGSTPNSGLGTSPVERSWGEFPVKLGRTICGPGLTRVWPEWSRR